VAVSPWGEYRPPERLTLDKVGGCGGWCTWGSLQSPGPWGAAGEALSRARRVLQMAVTALEWGTWRGRGRGARHGQGAGMGPDILGGRCRCGPHTVKPGRQTHPKEST
jgi:hypothetical protein